MNKQTVCRIEMMDLDLMSIEPEETKLMLDAFLNS